MRLGVTMAPRKRKPGPRGAAPAAASELRIIGGKWRRKKLAYHGDPVTRPMKERVREATFNLIGPSVVGTHALDLFAGTGVLALEALSRGAERATLIERHFPTARLIQDNIDALGAGELAKVIPGNAFLWASRLNAAADFDDQRPWMVFVSPPWELFANQKVEMLQMVGKIVSLAPEGSTIVVESDEAFDVTKLPGPEEWNVRTYAPAVISLRRM
jgi:16S rRNA (guanine966-N2)-methyltransferase